MFGNGRSVNRFQSTHSLRSATRKRPFGVGHPAVSIHALLAECDKSHFPSPGTWCGFNPRTPCGVRQEVLETVGFLVQVSIHALLAECDDCYVYPKIRQKGFNPRTPCGVRLGALIMGTDHLPGFNPRTPCGVRQDDDFSLAAFGEVSIHALLAECDVLTTGFGIHKCNVSIHALLAECDSLSFSIHSI